MKKTLFILMLIHGICKGNSSEQFHIEKHMKLGSNYSTAKNFDIFFENFKSAVDQKDTLYLRSILDENVKTLYDNTGKDAFFDFWLLKVMKEKSPLWTILERMTEAGYHKQNNGVYLLPGFLSDKPEEDDIYYVTKNTSLFAEKEGINELEKIQKGSLVKLQTSSQHNLQILNKVIPPYYLESYKEGTFEVIMNSNRSGFVKIFNLWDINGIYLVILQDENGLYKINSLL